MVLGGFSLQLKTAAPPARLWKAAVTDFHVIAPKIAPEVISSMEIAEGDGGVGTVKVSTFHPGVSEVGCYKVRVEEMDESKYHYKHSVIEGQKQHLESSVYTYKFEPAKDGGSLCTITGEYKTVGDHHELTEEEKNIVKEGFITTFKALDAFLKTNPTACA